MPLLALPQPAADPAAKAQRARELILAGKAEEAIPIYEELLRAFPDNAELLVNLTVAEFKLKRYREAARHAEAAAKLQPGSIAANLFLGSSRVELGEYAQALDPLEKVIAAQPEDRNARLMSGEALLGLGRPPEAVAQFQKAAGLAPENPKVWYGLGRAYEALSDDAARRLESGYPESPYWHALAGDAALRQRRNGRAFAEYRQSLPASSKIRGLHASLAAVYRRTGHADWAQIEEERDRQSPPADCRAGGPACDYAAGKYEQAARASESPASAENLYWLSKAYAALAREAFKRLTGLPPSLENHLHAAKAFEQEGRHRNAAREWSAALALAPGDERIQTSLAWSLFRADDWTAAIPVVLEALRSQPESAELQFLEGSCLLHLEQAEKAVPYLETAARLDANFLPAQAALGEALLLAGKPAEAIPHLKAALSADEDGSARFQLLRAYQLTNQAELAKVTLAQYRQARSDAEMIRRLEEGSEITAP